MSSEQEKGMEKYEEDLSIGKQKNKEREDWESTRRGFNKENSDEPDDSLILSVR